jgi:hypothetical protein
MFRGKQNDEIVSCGFLDSTAKSTGSLPPSTTPCSRKQKKRVIIILKGLLKVPKTWFRFATRGAGITRYTAVPGSLL